MNCTLELVREDGERFIHRCPKCKAEVRSKYRDSAMRKQTCGIAGQPALIDSLPAKDRIAFEHSAGREGMLLGDYIAAMTTAIGIPPCGGCDKRKEWLNAAHRWAKRRLAGTPYESPPDSLALSSQSPRPSA